MFGIFGSKESKEEKKFLADLKEVSLDYKHITDYIDYGTSEVLESRAYNFYKEKLPEESGFSASDFFSTLLQGRYLNQPIMVECPQKNLRKFGL